MEQAFLIPGLTPGGLGIWGIFIYLLAWSLKERRENKKLSAEERLAKREGFTAQVELLQRQLDNANSENRKLREDMRQSRAEQDDYRRLCQLENDQLRGDLQTVKFELDGYRRKLSALLGASILSDTHVDYTGVSDRNFQLPPRAKPEGAKDD